MRRMALVIAVCAVGLLVAGDLGAQTAPPARARQGQARGAGQAGADAEAQAISLVELQRLFDAYFVMQAQDALKIDDAKFAELLPTLKALQNVRRRHDQERRQIVSQLAKLTAPAAVLDEAQVRDRLRALQDLEGRAAADFRKAYEAIDQLLDVRQQARFRVFEQSMERRKLDLMLRARRGERPGTAGPGRRP